MGTGSILVGLGLTLLVVAYLAHPFRRTTTEADVEAAIETWVTQERARSARTPKCPRCGRRLRPRDRFCGACGASLQGDAP
jgi:hypothetical protein